MQILLKSGFVVKFREIYKFTEKGKKNESFMKKYGLPEWAPAFQNQASLSSCWTCSCCASAIARRASATP